MIFGVGKVTASVYLKLKLFIKKDIAQQISNSHRASWKYLSGLA